MGDREKASLRLQFNPQIRLELHGATIPQTPDLDPDDALDLTPIASDYLRKAVPAATPTPPVPLPRQSIYSRNGDTNDAERLSQDPAIMSWAGKAQTATPPEPTP